jgi:hypothetical protein
MYDSNFYFLENEINRYAIVDYTLGLEYNDDGPLDIYIEF